MLMDPSSLSFRAPEGGVGEGMVVMNMRCARAAVWNVVKEMQDGAGRVWMSDFKVRGAVRAYIYSLAITLGATVTWRAGG